MLLPEEVKPFICNEEKIVREHAVNYLANSFNRDEDILPLVIESCNKFGEDEDMIEANAFLWPAELLRRAGAFAGNM